MKKNDWILIVAVILYSWMFYEQTAGINFLIFSAALIALLIGRNAKLLRDGSWYVAASGTLISGVCVAMFGTMLSVVANVVSLTLLSALSISTRSSVILAGLYATYSYVSSVGFMIVDLIMRSKGSQKNRGSRFWIRLGIGAGILVVVIIFFVLYQRSNPLFLDLTRKIKLDFISWPWVRFTFLGFLLLYGFFYHRNFPAWFRWDTARPRNLDPQFYAVKENKIFGRNVNLNWEIYSAVILIALLNLLLLVVNSLDVYYLYITNELPAGMTYSDSVHQGTTNLIISIALAILIILFFFRGHINFAEKSKALKTLALIWILQNILILFSTAYRNYLYISEYNLTYKRIGVYIWLVLTLIGLIITFIKIYGKKSNWYLFRANGWAFYIFLVLFACQNWDLVITRFNIEKSKKLDKYYLLSLDSPAVIPELMALPQNENDIPGMPAEYYDSDRYNRDSGSEYEINDYRGIDYTAELHRRMYLFLTNYEEAGWQSWNRGDQETAQKLYSLCEEGKFKKLVLRNMGLDSLNVIRVFSNIEDLDLSLNHLGDLNDLASFKKLHSLNIGFNYLTNINSLPEFSGLTKLWLNNNKITDFKELKRQQKLVYLNISNNSGTIDLKSFSALKTLRELDISNNTVEDYAALKDLSALKSLSVSSMQQKDFKTLPELTNLEEINLSNDNLGYSNSEMLEKFSKFTSLKKINLSGNQLRTLNVLTSYFEEYHGFFNLFHTSRPVAALFPKLEELNLSQNSIEDLRSLDFYRGLKKLDLSNNSIDDISPVKDLKILEVLNISSTKTTTLDSLSGLVNLKELNISSNQIADLGALKNMKQLETLIASQCNIEDFSAIAALTKLKVLDLSNNYIRDLGFVKTLKSLEFLDIKSCSVTDFSALYGLENLKVLYLDYWVDRKIKNELKERLPGVRVVYGNEYSSYRY